MIKSAAVCKEEGKVMAYLRDSKSAIAVSEAGLHIVVDDILTPKEAMEPIADISKAVFEWSKMTGRFTDSAKKRHE